MPLIDSNYFDRTDLCPLRLVPQCTCKRAAHYPDTCCDQGSDQTGQEAPRHLQYRPRRGFTAPARRVQLDQKSATSSFFGALAGKKLVRFQEYAALYPEATFIFVGDNGQVPTGPSVWRPFRGCSLRGSKTIDGLSRADV